MERRALWVILTAGVVGCSALVLSLSGPRSRQVLAQASGIDGALRTVAKGLEYRESQLSELLGGAVVDSYYGPSYWRSLAKISDAVRETSGPHRDRDRALARFALSRSHYRLEVQSLYWGGADIFFPAAPDRDPNDIQGLYLIEGTTPDGISYQFSRRRERPTAWYHPIDDPPSGFCRGWPSVWLGVKGMGDRPLSAEVRESFEKAASLKFAHTEWGGVDCILVTLYAYDAKQVRGERARYWFVPDYSCALVKTERIGCNTDEPATGYRYVTEWRDFAQVTGLASPFPTRYIRWTFAYSKELDDATDMILDVRIIRPSTQAPPADDLLLTVFPPGTRLQRPISPSWAMREVSPEYRARMTESNSIWSDTYYWAKKAYKDVVPAFPDEWRTSLGQDTIQDLFAAAGSQEPP